MPLSDSKTRAPLHRRQITIDALRRPDGMTEIEATLVDTKPFEFRVGAERPNVRAGEAIHRISVRLVVDEDAVIRETEVAMDETPYHYCREVETRFDLNGIAMTNGFMKAVSERIGAADNCVHAMQVLPQMATVLVQATYPEKRDRVNRLPSGERPVPTMLNACLGWQDFRRHVREDHAEHYKEPVEQNQPRTSTESFNAVKRSSDR